MEVKILFCKKPSKEMKKNMLKKAGYRERKILDNAAYYVSSNNGRTIDIISKDGYRCQWDRKKNEWTN